MLVVPVIAVALFIFLFTRKHDGAAADAPGGMRRVTLATKDKDFRVIPPARGGAVGSVWYRPRDSVLAIQLRASGLTPNVHYRLELSLDGGQVYTVTSRAADSTGALAIDTTLTRFAEGVCVGDDWDPPRPLTGKHAIKFWVQRDGTPSTGTLPVSKPQARPGASLPCHGNGDGNFTYGLLENEVAHFQGK